MQANPSDEWFIDFKYLRNVIDEVMVLQWSENVYHPYFYCEQYFQCKAPCASTELISFRQHLGEEAVELLLKDIFRMNKELDKDGNDIGAVVSIDLMILEKNITDPTDDKLYKKIIKKCWKISDEEGIDLRQSYHRTIKHLGYDQRMNRSKYGLKKARKANRRIKIIAGRLVREIALKLSLEGLGRYLVDLKLYQRVISQKRTDTNKIYSLHEPHVKCYTKGKGHKKYKLGSKVYIVVDPSSGMILSAINFTEMCMIQKRFQKP